jgi:hypothetical protein
VRQAGVARAVLQRRDAGALQQPQVAAVRRAPDVERPSAAGGVVRGPDPVEQRVPGGQPAGWSRSHGSSAQASATARSSAARAAPTGSSSATPSRPSATSSSGTDDAHTPADTVPMLSG